jgi:hypothetical protein
MAPGTAVHANRGPRGSRPRQDISAAPAAMPPKTLGLLCSPCHRRRDRNRGERNRAPPPSSGAPARALLRHATRSAFAASTRGPIAAAAGWLLCQAPSFAAMGRRGKNPMCATVRGPIRAGVLQGDVRKKSDRNYWCWVM